MEQFNSQSLESSNGISISSFCNENSESIYLVQNGRNVKKNIFHLKTLTENLLKRNSHSIASSLHHRVINLKKYPINIKGPCSKLKKRTDSSKKLKKYNSFIEKKNIKTYTKHILPLKKLQKAKSNINIMNNNNKIFNTIQVSKNVTQFKIYSKKLLNKSIKLIDDINKNATLEQEINRKNRIKVKNSFKTLGVNLRKRSPKIRNDIFNCLSVKTKTLHCSLTDKKNYKLDEINKNLLSQIEKIKDKKISVLQKFKTLSQSFNIVINIFQDNIQIVNILNNILKGYEMIFKSRQEESKSVKDFHNEMVKKVEKANKEIIKKDQEIQKLKQKILSLSNIKGTSSSRNMVISPCKKRFLSPQIGNSKIIDFNMNNLANLDEIYFLDKVNMKHIHAHSTPHIPFLRLYLDKKENTNTQYKMLNINTFINNKKPFIIKDDLLKKNDK